MSYRSLLCACTALVLLVACSREDDKPIEKPDTTTQTPAEQPADPTTGTPGGQTPTTPKPDTAQTAKPKQETDRIVQQGPAVEEKGNTAPNRFIGMKGTFSKDASPRLTMATLRDIRTAQHEHFDRITFEFDSELVPGYHVEYVDKPVRDCGAGNVVPVEGNGWIEIRMTPAQAHTNDGHPTTKKREYKFAYPMFREVERTCDFEGTVTYVLGVAAPNKFRLLELQNPARLVIDVDH